MAKKKTSRKKTRRGVTARRKATRRKATPRRKPQGAVQEAWSSALEAMEGAQREAERQVNALLKRSNIKSRDAAGIVKELRGRLDRERKKTVKELRKQVGAVEDRIAKERRSFTHAVDGAVKGALAALNIPSRKEIAELTRKVDQLSKKIDALKR